MYPFYNLYIDIEDKILELDTNNNAELAKWIEILVKNFKKRFYLWGYDNKYDGYIDLLMEKKNPFRFRFGENIAACIYLHLTVDLPLAVADSLRDCSESQNRNAYRNAFLEMEAIFKNILKDKTCFSVLDLVYTQKSIRKRVPSTIKNTIPMSELLSWWPLLLRSRAWIYGEIIADLDKNEQPKIESGMIKEVTEFFTDFKSKGIIGLRITNLTPITLTSISSAVLASSPVLEKKVESFIPSFVHIPLSDFYIHPTVGSIELSFFILSILIIIKRIICKYFNGQSLQKLLAENQKKILSLLRSIELKEEKKNKKDDDL